MKNSGFGTQLRRRRAHRVTHLEEVVALLRASVGQLWMCAAQISLEEKAAFEDPDDPTPSAAAQSGSAGIPASSPLFLGRFWTTGHGRATEQGPPAQCRASRLAEACWAPCRLAWPHSAALQLRLRPLSPFSGVKPASHSAEPPRLFLLLLPLFS